MHEPARRADDGPAEHLSDALMPHAHAEDAKLGACDRLVLVLVLVLVFVSRGRTRAHVSATGRSHWWDARTRVKTCGGGRSQPSAPS